MFFLFFLFKPDDETNKQTEKKFKPSFPRSFADLEMNFLKIITILGKILRS